MEATQRSIQALAPAAQQQVQVELRRKAQHLRDQLEWAEKTLAPQAISDAKLERAFWPRPLIPVTPPIRHLSPARPPRLRHRPLSNLLMANEVDAAPRSVAEVWRERRQRLRAHSGALAARIRLA